MSFASHNVMKGMRRTVLAALGLTVLGITAAWATPVTTWHYDITSSFNTGQTQFNSNPNNCAEINTATTLAWGCPFAPNTTQSSLVLSPASATGVSVDTWTGGGAPPAANISNPGIVLTHNNFVIFVPGGVLQSGQLDNTITLTPFDPSGSAQSPIELNFGFTFTETPNTSGTCVDTTSPTPCNDIFVFDNASLDHSFTYLGDQYFLSLFPATGGALSPLSPDECTAAGAAAGCFGFTTIENQSNALEFGLSITSRPIIHVPEPGALGMLGFGLLGLGGLVFLRRRRASLQ